MRKMTACSDLPRRNNALKFCMRGHAREVVTYSSLVNVG